MNIYFNWIYRDHHGSQAWYEPIAVMDYQGNLANSRESQGHYTCDVKDVITNEWYRTNDSCNPVKIERNEVSKHGYVVLYKQLSQ